MRFWVGDYPPDMTFHPEREEWTKVREPGMAVGWLLAVPVMAALAVGTAFAFAAVSRTERESQDQAAYTTPVVPILTLVGLVLGTVIVHEALHLAGHPQFGLSPASIVGVWPKGGVAYVLYDGELPRDRYLTITALPLLALTLSPIALCWVVGEVPLWLAVVAVLNALGSAFDVLAIGIVLWQVPAGARVRGHGFDFYWTRRAVAPGAAVDREGM